MRECTQTITVFNARMDPDTGYDTYHPTILRGVSWHSDVSSNVTQSGLIAANKISIRIPGEADFSGKSYCKPEAYPSSDPESVFTLKQGDIIIHAEETEMLNPTQLREKYGEVVTILGVTDSRHRPRAKHWKVVGG